MLRRALIVLALMAFFLAPSLSVARVQDMGGGYVCNIASTTSGDTTWYFVGDCFYMGDMGGGGGGEYYPDPPSGGGSYNVCNNILRDKPSDCVNEVAMPASSEYGYGTSGSSQYAGGSGLPKLIAFKNSNVTAVGISAKLDNILRVHTQQLANGFVPRIDADTALTAGLQDICLEQNRLMPYPYSAGAEQCLRALNRLVQERNSTTFLSGLSQWVSANSANFGFSIGSVGFDFQTLISWVDPANSLEKKSNMIEKDRKCALWWQDARTAGCVP